MNDHPPNDRIEGVAAGDRDPQVEAHIAVCAACKAYAGRLEEAALSFRRADGGAELFLSKLAAAGATRPVSMAQRTMSWARVVYVGAPLIAAAAAIVLLVRAPALYVEGRPDVVSSVRLKGVGLAVIRERGGAQERAFGEVSVRAGDRLRIEVDLDRPLPISGGVLGADGAWLSLFSSTILEPGAHFSDQAVHFDDKPTEGWVLVGDPVAVDRARATRSFEDVTALRVRVEAE